MSDCKGFELLKIIKEDFEGAAFGLNRRNLRFAAYHVQQALEKILKYQLYNYDTNIVLYTHNIMLLIKKLMPYGVQVPQEIFCRADKITKWESESRYGELGGTAYNYTEIVEVYKLVKCYCDYVLGFDLFTI